MGRNTVARVFRGAYNALFRPSQFVRVDERSVERSVWGVTRQVAELLFVFAVNLLVYALPLTLAGLGSVPETGSGPLASVASNPGPTVRFGLRFLQNTLYLSGAAVATFVAFHGGVLLTRSSNGVLPSLYTVNYSTSGYLAAIFSFVMYIDTTEQLTQAANLLLWVQLTFIYGIVDATGSDLVLANAGRPGSIPPQGLSTLGRFLIAGLIVTACYYAYSMYLGSRLNHSTSRFTAALTLLAVLSTPVAFVIASVLAVTALGI